MADLKNLSVPEIVAYCQSKDGDGASTSQPVAAEAEPTIPAPAKPAASAAPAKADPGKMSVADMMAAARAEKAAGGSDSPAKPAAPAAASARKDPGKMSVADMMAAARGEKSAAATPKAKPAAKAAAAKGKAKPAAGKGKAAAAAKTGPMDTSSILAAARAPGTARKPGPISKAEAAEKAKGKPAGKKEKPKAPPMPAKPEYARPPATATKKKTDRRSALEVIFGSMLAVGWGAMTMAGGLGSLLVARFFFPNLLVEPPSRFKVGFPGNFAAGTVATKFKATFGIWVVNADYEGVQQLAALKTVCTHLGCTPNWLEAEQKFKCPCHGSGFYKEGINFEGPAPRPLERYAIRVADDGQIEIDKSKTFQEQLGQWSDGSSFVSV